MGLIKNKETNSGAIASYWKIGLIYKHENFVHDEKQYFVEMLGFVSKEKRDEERQSIDLVKIDIPWSVFFDRQSAYQYIKTLEGWGESEDL